MLIRWALEVQEYQFTVRHRPGKLSANVDSLSRAPLPEVDLGEVLDELEDAESVEIPKKIREDIIAMIHDGHPGF